MCTLTVTEQINAGIAHINDGQKHMALSTTHIIDNTMKLSPTAPGYCAITIVRGCSCTTTYKVLK